jgi:hypothetical protein
MRERHSLRLEVFMRHSIVRSILLATAAAAVPAVILGAQIVAKPNVKLGLWESTTTIEGRGAGETHKICITDAKLATGDFDEAPDQNCKRTLTKSTTTAMEITEACADRNDPSMNGTGTLHIDVLSPTSVKGTLTTKISMAGRSMTVNGTFTSKFVSADCGNVK